jgi:hypothetical protein
VGLNQRRRATPDEALEVRIVRLDLVVEGEPAPGDGARAGPGRGRRRGERAECGRMGWQRASGYNYRALVESDIARWKRVIGDGLRSRTDGRQGTEVAVAAGVPNRMLELGRPEYVRIA